MAIEDILATLDEQAEAETHAVLNEAHEHATLILEEGDREARQIHDGFTQKVERIATAEAGRTVNAARLEAKMIVSSVKGDGVASVFDAASATLSGASGGDYPSLFAALASEAFDGVDGPVTVRVRAADASLAHAAAEKAGLPATVDATLDTAGGLVVEAQGGRVIRRNTLEDRLERSKQLIQADVAKVLFP
jgi:vacuolar-type H+-ATPase subunit E/Vma4